MKALMTATRVDYCELEPGIGSGLKKSDSSRWTVRNALIEHGFDVDLRPVHLGEDLSEYDLVVLDANDPRGPKTQHHYGALWTLVVEAHGGPRVVMNWDHWDIRRIWRGLIKEDVTSPSGPRTEHYDTVQRYRRELEQAQERIAFGGWPPSMVCGFKWAEQDRIAQGTDLQFSLVFDPSMDQPMPEWGPNREWDPIAIKERRWVLAALSNHETWVSRQGLRWPVRYVGCVGAPKMDRDALLGLYRASWGILSPKYYHVGSGYWRARIAHAVRWRCVLWSHPAEMHGFKDWPASDIVHTERLGPEELDRLTKKQHGAFVRGAERREDCIARVGSFLLRQAKQERQPQRELEMFGQTSLI